MNKSIHALIFSFSSVCFLLLLHFLPINQAFIDPFSEYIKHQDLMDITCSRFRDHMDPKLFDNRIFIINTGITDRQKIISAIDFLQRHAVKAVGVDLLFDSLAGNAQDTVFHNLVGNSASTVFAKVYHGRALRSTSDSAEYSHSFLVPADHQFYVNLGTDDGYTARSFQPFYDGQGAVPSFPVAIAAKMDSHSIKQLSGRGFIKEWINFRRFQSATNDASGRKERSFPNYAVVDLDRFLEDTASYESNYFANKAVLFGFCDIKTAASLKDRYFTPLNQVPVGRSLPDMYGVVIHANIISMILDNDYINEFNVFITLIIAFLIFGFNYLLFERIHNRKYFFNLALIRLLQLLQFVILFSISIWMLAQHNLKLGFVMLVAAIIFSYELWEFYFLKIRWRIDALFARWSEKLKNA